MKVFEPGNIRGLTMKNRFWHSPTYEALADHEGRVTPELIALNHALAAGGVGANTVSFAFVHPTGRHIRNQIGIHSDKMIPGLCRLADDMRTENCRSFIQIAHSGVHAREMFSGLKVALGPSAMVNRKFGPSREMTQAEIEQAVEWFVLAAARAKKAGFDGVMIHAAHGYLVSAFLSPHYNKRQDDYGGSVKKRARFFLDILHGIRQEAGGNYPIIAKMNSEDGIPGGLTPDMMIKTALLLEQNGMDAIELSYGISADGGPSSSPAIHPKTPDDEGYYMDAALKYKENVPIPLLQVGGFRSLEGCERALQKDAADFISLSRPLIREPNLINRWLKGDTARAKCTSCNLCRDYLFDDRSQCLICIPELAAKNEVLPN